MGAKDHLVAVSTYDNQRPDVGNLPRVGDYQNIDWEMLQSLHPSAIVIQIQIDRLPAGFSQRAADLHADPVNVTINRLADIDGAMTTLGNAMGTPDLASAATTQMRQRLNAVRSRAAGQPPVKALIVVGDGGDSLAGSDTYLDDLLHLAGGVNAAGGLKTSWPQVDREMLLSLKPDVIIQLMPSPSPQERQQAAAVWKQLPQIPAVAAGRVYVIDNWYALLPGWHVTDLAEQFAQCLHPSMPTSSTSQPPGVP
jgi:ABC-type Fe3+-hydroxamate transport system substrate-binding protein